MKSNNFLPFCMNYKKTLIFLLAVTPVMSVATSEIPSESSTSTTTALDLTTQEILDIITEILPSSETDTETITLLPTSLNLGKL